MLPQSSQDLIQLNKFGGVLVGTPSLQTVGGHYWLAATIRSGGDFPILQASLYALYRGYHVIHPVLTVDTGYQCDVIDESGIPMTSAHLHSNWLLMEQWVSHIINMVVGHRMG